MAVTVRRACRCGHQKDAHEHYRRGTDCSACTCAKYAGRLQVTLGSTRLRSVSPDVIHQPVEPYVRPTHTAGAAGLPARPPLLPVQSPRVEAAPTDVRVPETLA